MTPQALAGIRVLDLGQRMSTAWCSRLLADFGAEVHYPADHPLERHGPFAADSRSIPARYALANKIPRTATAAALLLEVGTFDVLIDDAVAHSGHALALRNAIVAAQHPGLLRLSITANGTTGARAAQPGNDLTAYAWSGWASVNGIAGRPPLKGSGFQASFQAGTLAAAAVTNALLERLASGAGQHIDVGEADVLAFTFAPALLRTAYTGENVTQREDVDFTSGPVPCKDGYFALTPSRERFWIEAMRVLGLPDLADDVQLQQPWSRAKQRDRYVPRVHAALRNFTKAELFAQLGARRVIAGPVLHMNELATDAHLFARGFFVEYAGARFPGAPFRLQRSPWALRATPVAASGAASASAAPASGAPRHGVNQQRSAHPGPLAGVRGVVLTQAWAGTLATQLLGLLGADIVQVEPFSRLDSWRGSYQQTVLPAFATTATAHHSWNCNPLFNSVNLNKRSVTLDLAQPHGVDAFRELVKNADFVAENFSPRVMGNLGLDYAALCKLRPDIILLSLSGYGHTGPSSNVPAIGGTIEPTSGMSALLGYGGEMPQNSGQMYPDAVCGLYGHLALSLALLHRARTGEGQFIDLSMQEACLTFVGDAWLDFALSGNVPGTAGNRHPDHAPHGIFPAAAAADGARWLALACTDDRAFASLSALAGQPQWLAKWSTAAARKADEGALEAAIGQWTVSQPATAVAAALGRVGICAAPVQRCQDVLADAGLRARGVIALVDHPEAGSHWQAGLPCMLSRTPAAITRHAPLLGEHTRAVLEAAFAESHASMNDGAVAAQDARLDALLRSQAASDGTPEARRRT